MHLQHIDFQQPNSCFSQKSLPAIAWVRRPIYERVPVSYADEWFDSYIPNKTLYIPESIRVQLYREGKRSQREDPAGTYAHQIFSRLLIDLSYNSSRLEGIASFGYQVSDMRPESFGCCQVYETGLRH